jgi:septal ring-binding cell division protein DamX
MMGGASSFPGGQSGRAMQDIPFKGSISDISLPRLIGQLHRQSFEGTLRLVIGSTAKVVYFKLGEIASAASNAETDRLANILIQAGRLTQEQLELAKSRVQAGGSLGKTLIAMGFLTPAELLRGAREQVRQILRSCFLLTSGSYQCDAGPLPREVTVLGLPTKRLIFDSLMHSGNRQAIIRQLGSMESVYAPTEELIAGLEALGLEPSMAEVAKLLDGTRTLRDLSGHTSLDDFTVSKLFLALEILGLARPTGSSPAPAGTAGQGQRIEISPEVEPEEPEIILLEEDQESDAEPAIMIAEPPPAPEAPREPVGDVPSPQDADSGTEGGLATPAYEAEESCVTPAQEAEESFAVLAHEAPPPDRVDAMPDDADEPTLTVGHGGEAVAAPNGTFPDPATGGDSIVEAPPMAEEAPLAEEAPPSETSGPERSRATEPGWQVDPDTGERVAFGPVRLTFDGKVSSDRKRSLSWAHLLGLAAVIIAMVGSALFFLSRDGGDADNSGPTTSLASKPDLQAESRRSSPDQARVPAETPMEPTGEPPPDDDRTESAEAADPAAYIRPADTGEPNRLAAVLSADSMEDEGAPSAPVPEAAEPSVEPAEGPPAPEEKKIPGEPPRGSASPFSNASHYASALRMLDAGDAARAAGLFQDLVTEEDPGRFTMQLMIACQVDTLQSVRSSSGDLGSLYFVPFFFKGRDCFRVCWGIYASREEALAARSALPSSYAESGITPVVVSLSRLRPPT